MRTIHLTRLGAIGAGDHIISVDDDDLLDDAAINASYDASEQDWQCVAKRRGHADIGDLLLVAYDGSREWVRGWSWDATVWQLVDDGEPVVDEDVRRASYDL